MKHWTNLGDKRDEGAFGLIPLSLLENIPVLVGLKREKEA